MGRLRFESLDTRLPGTSPSRRRCVPVPPSPRPALSPHARRQRPTPRAPLRTLRLSPRSRDGSSPRRATAQPRRAPSTSKNASQTRTTPRDAGGARDRHRDRDGSPAPTPLPDPPRGSAPPASIARPDRRPSAPVTSSCSPSATPLVPRAPLAPSGGIPSGAPGVGEGGGGGIGGIESSRAGLPLGLKEGAALRCKQRGGWGGRGRAASGAQGQVQLADPQGSRAARSVERRNRLPRERQDRGVARARAQKRTHLVDQQPARVAELVQARGSAQTRGSGAENQNSDLQRVGDGRGVDRAVRCNGPPSRPRGDRREAPGEGGYANERDIGEGATRTFSVAMVMQRRIGDRDQNSSRGKDGPPGALTAASPRAG